MAFFKIHIGVKKTQLTHRFWFQSSGLADMPKHTYFFFFFSLKPDCNGMERMRSKEVKSETTSSLKNLKLGTKDYETEA